MKSWWQQEQWDTWEGPTIEMDMTDEMQERWEYDVVRYVMDPNSRTDGEP